MNLTAAERRNVGVIAASHPDGAASTLLALDYDRLADATDTQSDRERAQIIDTLRRHYGWEFADYLEAWDATPGLKMMDWMLEEIAKCL